MLVDGALLGTDPTASGAAAKAYEDHGFDGVLAFEGPHDPFLPLALAARDTERVQLATGVAIAFARNPMTCAYQANDLQLISRGRFLLGLGTQIRPHIERRFSETWHRPLARIREYVDALRAIWRCWQTGERLAFRGRFYTHTLMTPFLSPGPNPHGPPPILLAGFGPAMIRVAGSVADGWIVHPLHSRDYVSSIALPALAGGLAGAGRSRATFAISCQIIVMLGRTDEEIQRARQQARAQIAFYGSTPAYRILLDHHGWGDLQPRLNQLSKEGRWAEMVDLVTDEMLDTIGVSGTPADVTRRLLARCDFADRVSPVLYNETDPDAVVDIVRGLQRGPTPQSP
jgi:probable F420-dependent oxidoreductase